MVTVGFQFASLRFDLQRRNKFHETYIYTFDLAVWSSKVVRRANRSPKSEFRFAFQGDYSDYSVARRTNSTQTELVVFGIELIWNVHLPSMIGVKFIFTSK